MPIFCSKFLSSSNNLFPLPQVYRQRVLYMLKAGTFQFTVFLSLSMSHKVRVGLPSHPESIWTTCWTRERSLEHTWACNNGVCLGNILVVIFFNKCLIQNMKIIAILSLRRLSILGRFYGIPLWEKICSSNIYWALNVHSFWVSENTRPYNSI